MRIFMILIAVVLVAGCATPAQRAAKAQRDVDEMITVYGPACEKFGYKADSDPWRDCILRLNAKDIYQRGYSIPLY